MERRQQRFLPLEKPDIAMHTSAKLHQCTSFSVVLFSCDKVYHKQEVRIILYLLGQFVIGQYYTNQLD